MKRRTLLRLTTMGSALTQLSGCLSHAESSPIENSTDESSANGDSTQEPSAESPIPLEEINTPSVDDCGPADLPLSALLSYTPSHGTLSKNTGKCAVQHDVSVVLENERSESVQVTIDVRSSDEQVFEKTYDLEPGERYLDRKQSQSTFPAEGDHIVTVTVNDEEPVTGGWYGISCDRHGIAILPDGVAIGYEPQIRQVHGSCYAGEERSLAIFNGDAQYTVTARVHDHCRDETTELTWEMEPEDVEHMSDVFRVGGGLYEVIIDVAEGERIEKEFTEICQSLQVVIGIEGDVTIRRGVH